MCGIAVSVDTTGRGRADAWALDLIRHRGPDGEGTFDDGGDAVLEHCRLAVIDPDNREADQPFFDPSGRYSLVYNGEIFNFRELRRELEARGVRFRTNSDTEVVLLGYIELGETLFARLRGMFAFAVWDREERTLVAARDHVGVKPLYYASRDGMIALCSEVRPFLRHPAVRARLEPESVVEYLAFGHNFGDRTLLEDVRKLPPGHFLRARGGEVVVREFWDVVPADGASPEAAEAERELLELLDDAVEAAMVSDVPVGFMLSGGVDSSTVAVLAARHADPASLTAYSVSFGLPNDEATAARRLAHDLGLRHREVRLTRDDVRAQFEEWLERLDYPSPNPTWIASAAIARAAREDGLKVLLSGDGGDELFGGYTRWMKYLRFHERVWRPTPEPLLAAAGAVGRRVAGGLAGDIARRASERKGLFVPSRPLHDDLLARCLGPAGLAAAFARPPETAVEELHARFRERAPDGDYLGWMSYASLKTTLVEDFLQRLDKMGMMHSVEGRVPLLDPKLARFAFRLPQSVKVPRFQSKLLFRRAVARLLPDYVLERPKQGFCPPVGAWAEELMTRRQATATGPLFDDALVDRNALATARAAQAPFAAWTLATLLDWTQRNLA